MRDAVIVAAIRTPIGKGQARRRVVVRAPGRSVRPHDPRPGRADRIDPAAIDDVIGGGV